MHRLAAFDENDRDRSGQIDFDELSALFKKMNIEKEPHEVEEMLAAADKGVCRATTWRTL